MYVYIYIQYVHIFIYEVENGALPWFIFSLTVKETYGIINFFSKCVETRKNKALFASDQ